jgi:hypothetical protein
MVLDRKWISLSAVLALATLVGPIVALAADLDGGFPRKRQGHLQSQDPPERLSGWCEGLAQ